MFDAVIKECVHAFEGGFSDGEAGRRGKERRKKKGG